MLFFKKKKQMPQIHFALDIAKEEARGRDYFYHPLSQSEVQLASTWALHNDMLMTLSHTDGKTLVYKFQKWERKNND